LSRDGDAHTPSISARRRRPQLARCAQTSAIAPAEPARRISCAASPPPMAGEGRSTLPGGEESVLPWGAPSERGCVVGGVPGP